MTRLATKILAGIDLLNEYAGRMISWLTTALVLVVCVDVTLRYLLSQTSAWIFELEWHMFSLIFLIGAAYTLKQDKHVRVDVFYDRYTPTQKAWVNLLGTWLLLIPMCVVVIRGSGWYIDISYTTMEGSPQPGGLPYRFLIKSAIPFGYVLLLLQAIAETIRNLFILLGYPMPEAPATHQ
ncbi:TRAP transporter small permease subunit [Pontibacter sp. G13]|uniref:TRAP transporter small permease subunit n=1 Tax=Pontibacter sp. G13 TaxID=3074898 RepID=UPI0028891D18|nr:TRAP transporter small permease subunit [Pontibacter sp. G13]WNJ19879.1 TRAP transporter small permease subunit [Pontibacter sp. G13]